MQPTNRLSLGGSPLHLQQQQVAKGRRNNLLLPLMRLNSRSKQRLSSNSSRQVLPVGMAQVVSPSRKQGLRAVQQAVLQARHQRRRHSQRRQASRQRVRASLLLTPLPKWRGQFLRQERIA
jgi:hypothetical protein